MKIKYIDEVEIHDKKILLRVDYNVTILPDSKIDSNERLKRTIPTIELLLKNGGKLILMSHLGRPQGKDPKFSLKPVAEELQKLLPSQKIIFVEDFNSDEGQVILKDQKESEIVLLENLRFYEEEKNNDFEFAKKLSGIADVYVNDAFSISHRNHTSIVGVPKLIPSYGGLLLKNEVQTISEIVKNPNKPYVVIMGGAKISTKIDLLEKLMGKADAILTGGGIANTILKQQGYVIGKSLYEEREKKETGELMQLSKENNTQVVLPVDVVVANDVSAQRGEVKKVDNVLEDDVVLDIGPETCEIYKEKILQANTIVWNGPMGYFENPEFKRGTDCVYDAIISNGQAASIVGGGQTLAAISKKDSLDKITHISTGGGAMLKFIEKSTLPGLEALAENSNS